LSIVLPASFDPTIYLSLAFLFGIAAQFRAMDGYTFLRSAVVVFERRVGILFAVALVTLLFSPFLLNDVLIIVLTPVIVRYARQHGVDPVPLIVTEITLTNVSSSLTPIGNPQNLLLWTDSGVSFWRFIAGTWWLVLLSAGLTALALVPLARRIGAPREFPASVFPKLPALYLLIVVMVTLGLAFTLGFLFNARSLGQVRREFDFRALAVLYLFVAAVTLFTLVLSSILVPLTVPVARGDQPYSGLFFGLSSNFISNVPATQLVLSTAHVSASVAPKLAVDAGLAGNLGPIASFANLLALQIAGKAGVPVRRIIMLQLAVGLVSFIPALL
jgi:Na+/H+ antiporter NhaD/arsenite permease-like protein